MAETLHPDVFTEEVSSVPSITGASTSTAGFVGTARRGPDTELGFISSFKEFERRYGKNFPDSFLEDALYGYFLNGGKRAFIARALGSGAAKASTNLPALSGAPSAAQIDGTNVGPFNLAPGNTLTIEVDGGLGQTFTFTATRAVRAATGVPGGTPGAGTTLLVTIDGGLQQTITFAGTESTAALIAAAINAQLSGGYADVDTGAVRIASDTLGSGSSVNIDAGSTALVATSFTAGTTSGTGNVANIDAVTITEVVTITAALVGAVVSSNGGMVRITHSTPGAGNTLEVTTAPTAFGLPSGVEDGADDAPVNLFTVSFRDKGAEGNKCAITTERWRTTTTAILATAGTSIALTDVSKVEVGDVVRISDGVTTTHVHVHTINISTKVITFDAVTLGSPIAAGALVNTASAHRARSTVVTALLTTDTLVTLVSASQMRVGDEVSFDNGTTTTFRKILNVNGNEITLDAAIGVAYAAGTPVVTQHFHLSVALNNAFDRSHTYLSAEDENDRDWIELRLGGTTNESLNIEAVDLNPVIVSALLDRPAPVVGQLLTGGADGSAPSDQNYLDALELLGELNRGQVNIVLIPGITTVAVQQGLSDFGDARADVIVIHDGPLSADEPLEIRDWRLNQLNRSSSYGALYYPWVEITDRYGPNRDAVKEVPPSGYMAGIYAHVDSRAVPQSTTGAGPWVPPANLTLKGVRDVVRRVSDGEQDLLNPVGINVLRVFDDEGTGVRVWGARTLFNVEDGRHYVHIRRTLNYVKISVARSLRRYLFGPIQPALFERIVRDITGFYYGIWLQGGLFPNDSFDEAQFTKCDEENNQPETRRLGQVYVESGINVPFPAEFIIFRVGLLDGSTSLEEFSQSA